MHYTPVCGGKKPPGLLDHVRSCSESTLGCMHGPWPLGGVRGHVPTPGLDSFALGRDWKVTAVLTLVCEITPRPSPSLSPALACPAAASLVSACPAPRAAPVLSSRHARATRAYLRSARREIAAAAKWKG